jgi:hypothetical protein
MDGSLADCWDLRRRQIGSMYINIQYLTRNNFPLERNGMPPRIQSVTFYPVGNKMIPESNSRALVLNYMYLFGVTNTVKLYQIINQDMSIRFLTGPPWQVS